MPCSSSQKEGSYDFFNDVFEYIKKADNAKIDSISGVDYSCCNSFSSIMKSKLKTEENAKSICKQFIKLHKSLTHIEEQSNGDPDYEKDCGFLNYWINFILYNNVTDENTCVSTFHNTLESHCSEELEYSLSSCKMYNINKEELDKMTMLYNLHNKRYEIHTIINSQDYLKTSNLYKTSTECSTEYKKELAMCNNKDEKFCRLLENFKTEYENLYPMVETKGPEFTNNFKRLSGDENINMISTAVIGSAVGLIPLFGILYKFTPMGQMLNLNKGKVTDGQRYNVDDMREISLMDNECEQLKFHHGTYNIKYQSA